MATHHFQPKHYHTTIGTHKPILHIADGDTVVTTTVDAAGYDASDQQVTPAGNPQTGPFYIEGAEPGDTVVLHLEKLSPNRSRGFSSAMLAPGVVDPDYVPQLPWPSQTGPSRAVWQVDSEAGTARLLEPKNKLSHLEFPLRPMLGCFGVAPPGAQAISTATSWVHGGNMDYRGFSEGVTVFLPVFAPGALLFVGDGHALQGDGEIAGTGIEISMEVQFRVELLKGRTIRWPRGQDRDFIFTVGNARPLDQAVQHATTEMLRWLLESYELDPVAANILMGQCVAYDLGNVFDPAYTMVCKMPRRLLE